MCLPPFTFKNEDHSHTKNNNNNKINLTRVVFIKKKEFKYCSQKIVHLLIKQGYKCLLKVRKQFIINTSISFLKYELQ